MANWNTSSDESMSGMFQEMNKVKDLSFISNWDVSSVKDMSYLFQNDYALTHVGDLSHWNTNKVGTVSDLNYSFAMMFTGCEPLQEIKGIEHWDFTHAHSMRGMFMDTPVLNRADLSQATKPVNLQIATSMFDGSGAT
ncbi:BspA family leucine-rich repeat surface protein [Lactobacillus amylovorus]|uniref:BspA family leucine-rich repeat surface protein n=1 Tax=Lactobacillus amylovorus TaxID=1604 RepID=UPI003F8A2864